MSENQLLRSLGLKETLALVIGGVVGTGVFLKAGIMSNQVGSGFWVLAAFLVSGFLSLCGALCYAELGSLFPKAGGEYVFLKEAYGEALGFLYGWTRFWIGSPASIAAYAVGAVTFLSGVTSFGGHGALAAIALIWIFSLVNCLSVAFGGAFQAILTILKIFMIIGLTLAIFGFGQGASWGHLSTQTNVWPGFSAFGAAMIGALWAYDGWNNMPMVAGEIKNPSRNIPIALGVGMGVVLLIYLLANLSYFYALPFSEVVSSYSRLHPDALPVATLAATRAFGPVAAAVLSIAFVVSAVGAMNGSILTNARVPYAMAEDKYFFPQLAKLSRKNRVPVISILVQALVSSALALSGSFDQLTDYVVFASWIYYALGCGSIFIFRRKGLRADYQVPFYPWLPLFFIFSSIFLLGNTLMTSPRESITGVLFILIGIPFYFYFKKLKLAP